MRIAEHVVAAPVERGAEGIALVGSRAGETPPSSDVDLAVIGEGLRYRLEIDEGLLVSVGWASVEEQRGRLYDPDWLGTHVPGWRQTVVLHDPEGLAAEVKDEASAGTGTRLPFSATSGLWRGSSSSHSLRQ